MGISHDLIVEIEALEDQIRGLKERIADLAEETEENRKLFGIGAANGDVVDWLYAWLNEPTSGSSKAVLAMYLHRHGYEDGGELLTKIA